MHWHVICGDVSVANHVLAQLNPSPIVHSPICLVLHASPQYTCSKFSVTLYWNLESCIHHPQHSLSDHFCSIMLDDTSQPHTSTAHFGVPRLPLGVQRLTLSIPRLTWGVPRLTWGVPRLT
ncbi:hypothetical protein NPIL_193791 [Nephila pilipes]|uniref:Uncharacterized protein n=1 Tax=Nephila pilipes TaxID=299642 RepID=A0A8X6UA57_NEPPI|nr:hypothetical protein NPIL_193791 [Nephila pilipes]